MLWQRSTELARRWCGQAGQRRRHVSLLTTARPLLHSFKQPYAVHGSIALSAHKSGIGLEAHPSLSMACRTLELELTQLSVKRAACMVSAACLPDFACGRTLVIKHTLVQEGRLMLNLI